MSNGDFVLSTRIEAALMQDATPSHSFWRHRRVSKPISHSFAVTEPYSNAVASSYNNAVESVALHAVQGHSVLITGFQERAADRS